MGCVQYLRLVLDIYSSFVIQLDFEDRMRINKPNLVFSWALSTKGSEKRGVGGAKCIGDNNLGWNG